jgi:hypothetical protein
MSTTTITYITIKDFDNFSNVNYVLSDGGTTLKVYDHSELSMGVSSNTQSISQVNFQCSEEQRQKLEKLKKSMDEFVIRNRDQEYECIMMSFCIENAYGDDSSFTWTWGVDEFSPPYLSKKNCYVSLHVNNVPYNGVKPFHISEVRVFLKK